MLVSELRSTKRPRWKQATDSFLRNVPKPSAWRQQQVEAGLKSVEDYEKIIKAFLNFTNADVKRGSNQTPLFKFKAFLLLSFCRVLEQSRTSTSSIDQIVRCIINASENQRLRVLRGAFWVNSLISELTKRGWNIYRATELFFISMSTNFLRCKPKLMQFLDPLSLSALGFIRNDESLRLILKHFGTEEFVNHDFNDCLEPRYSIPGLVAYLASSSARRLL